MCIHTDSHTILQYILLEREEHPKRWRSNVQEDCDQMICVESFINIAWNHFDLLHGKSNLKIIQPKHKWKKTAKIIDIGRTITHIHHNLLNIQNNFDYPLDYRGNRPCPLGTKWQGRSQDGIREKASDFWGFEMNEWNISRYIFLRGSVCSNTHVVTALNLC